MGRYILPDHPAIIEAETYGWPRLDDMLDDEMLVLFDDEGDDYDEVAEPAWYDDIAEPAWLEV